MVVNTTGSRTLAELPAEALAITILSRTAQIEVKLWIRREDIGAHERNLRRPA